MGREYVSDSSIMEFELGLSLMTHAYSKIKSNSSNKGLSLDEGSSNPSSAIDRPTHKTPSHFPALLSSYRDK